MKPTFLRLNGSEVDATLDDGQLPDGLAEWIETALAEMKDEPGMDNREITLVLVNDFEEDEEEDEESDDEETETEGKEVK